MKTLEKIIGEVKSNKCEFHCYKVMKLGGKFMEKFYEEYVKINDIRQYFLHYPNESNCVILFLHGGPGQTEAQLSYKIIPQNRNYSIVYYDQRGTGKTQSKNKSKIMTITVDTLINDLKESVEYIHQKYPNKKLIILGHSWGSILGIEYIKKYSDTVDGFVGMGQVINFKLGEKVSYEHCYKLASEKHKRKLIKIEDYPNCINEKNINAKCPRFRKIQAKYKLMGYKEGNMKLVKIFTRSPIYSIKDVFQMMKAMKTNKNLLKYLVEYDTSDYTKFSIPIYFICGENDWQVPSVVVEEYYNTISAPDKGLYWIKDAGHLTDLDNPIEYNNVLESICDKLQKQL